jgi:hypothetical protein
MSRSVGVFLFVDTGDLSFVDKAEGWEIFNLEDLPLMVRGRINMLRLAQDYSYVEGLGYKGKVVCKDSFARGLFSVNTLELTVYVEDDELEQLRKLCPTIIVSKHRDSHNEKAD